VAPRFRNNFPTSERNDATAEAASQRQQSLVQRTFSASRTPGHYVLAVGGMGDDAKLAAVPHKHNGQKVQSKHATVVLCE
jgi:hypothetical protein